MDAGHENPEMMARELSDALRRREALAERALSGNVEAAVALGRELLADIRSEHDFIHPGSALLHLIRLLSDFLSVRANGRPVPAGLVRLAAQTAHQDDIREDGLRRLGDFEQARERVEAACEKSGARVMPTAEVRSLRLPPVGTVVSRGGR